MSEVDPDLATPKLQPGSTLGKYRLIEQIGQGGMGTVFSAEHLDLGRLVAIKVLDRGSHHDPAHATRFQREAELVSRIGHPNIVAVYDFGQTAEGSPYYVMEHLSGETLRSRVKRGPLSIAEVRSIFTPLLSAIAAAHAINVIHRDLKPDRVTSVAAA
jgi:serine/threonine protein kinase